MSRITLEPTRWLALLTAAVVFAGCDTTADRELRRAEEALDKAMAVSADAHATDDYNKAEEYFNLAQEANDRHKIQEAREYAIKAKLAAEDAESKSKERLRILEEEYDRLGR